MAITQITNNVILDGTILPAKLNVASTLRTFLSSATSANLAAAVIGTTGSGNLVFATSPTLTTPILGAATGTTLFLGTGTLNSTAILELSSTTRGFLHPRMTSTQRNAISGSTVPSGLTVFNSTDNALSVYTTVLSSWDNIFTTRQGSFDASILRNACSNDTGTGNLVFSANPTFESAFVGGILNISGNLSASGALSASSITLAGNLSSSGNVRASSVTVLGSLSASGNITSNSRYVVSAALSADVTINTGDTQLLLPLIKLDPSSWTSVVSSITRVTPTVPGYYNINYQIAWRPGVSNQQQNIQILRNGNTVSLAQKPIDTTAGVNTTQVTTAVVFMNGTTDYVTVQAFTSDATQTIVGDSNWSKVEMFKIN